MTGVDNSGYGIVFGRSGSDYLSFEITGNGHFRFVKCLSWNNQSLIPFKRCDVIRELDTNHLRIMKVGGRFQFYVNGKFVDSFQSESFFGENFGFAVLGKQTVKFRNFKFSRMKPNENGAYFQGIVVTSKNFSCIKNLSVLYLSQAVDRGTLKRSGFEKVLSLAEKFFSDDAVEAYSNLIAGERFVLDREKALGFYVNALIENLRPCLDQTYGVTTADFISSFSVFPGKISNLVKDNFVSKRFQNVRKALEQSEELEGLTKGCSRYWNKTYRKDDDRYPVFGYGFRQEQFRVRGRGGS